MRTEDMTPEQLEEAGKLQTPEEMLAYARDQGIDLTDEEIDAIAGGFLGTPRFAIHLPQMREPQIDFTF